MVEEENLGANGSAADLHDRMQLWGNCRCAKKPTLNSPANPAKELIMSVRQGFF